MNRHFLLIIVCISLSFLNTDALAQSFQPAKNRADLNRMLSEIELDDWSDIKTGRVYHIRINLLPDEVSLFEFFGMKPPPFAILSVGVPRDFNWVNPHPMLFTSVTGDIYAPNAYSIRNYYLATQATDWVVISVDGSYWPKSDTVIWRATLLGVAMRFLKQNWPDFNSSPITYGGYSGGSKLSVKLAYLSEKMGKRPCGLFLGGCNEAPLEETFELTEVPTNVLTHIPVYYSLGKLDRIATPRASKKVVDAMRKKGFLNQKIAIHEAGHRLVESHITEALQYFESFF